MGWSKLFKGEPMPDKNDPKYKERYERDYNAGSKFARMTGLTWLGQKIVGFANAHKRLYLVLVLGFGILVFLVQVCRISMNYMDGGTYVPVTERVDSALHNRFNHYQNLDAVEQRLK